MLGEVLFGVHDLFGGPGGIVENPFNRAELEIILGQRPINELRALLVWELPALSEVNGSATRYGRRDFVALEDLHEVVSAHVLGSVQEAGNAGVALDQS